MKKNVTISLDEDVLKAVRRKAAEAGVSFQDLVRQVLSQVARPPQEASLKEFWDLADQIGARSGGRYLKREELYDREVLRRHECLLVRERPGGPKETKGRPSAPRKPRKR